jgi:hypothetical protein
MKKLLRALPLQPRAAVHKNDAARIESTYIHRISVG